MVVAINQRLACGASRHGVSDRARKIQQYFSGCKTAAQVCGLEYFGTLWNRVRHMSRFKKFNVFIRVIDPML